MQEPSEREKELDFNRFCSYSITDVLGACVESEYLYIVQAQKISVYEYYGKFDKPQLSLELIHNKIILDYSINKHFICIRSTSLIEVRDRKHWENVVFTYQLANSENFQYMALEDHFLYVAQKDGGNLVVEKIEIETKNIVSLINLGKLNDKASQVLKKIKPIFLNQLGMLNNFYIWAKSSQEVELGMLYTSQGASKKKFQINQIDINNGKIHQIFHHRVNCVKYPNQSPQYVILFVQKDKQKQIYAYLYEIVSRDQSKKDTEDQKMSDFHGQFQGILNQFSFLKNLNEKSAPNSLVQQVFSEAIGSENHGKHQNTYFQVKLQNIFNYLSSFYQDGKIWVVSEKKICQIELMKEECIENIVKSYRTEQKVIKSISFQDKPLTKQSIGLYKQKLLFSEITTSFEIAYTRQDNEQIAQQIEQFEINDEILEKQAEIKIKSQSERLRNNFLLLTVGAEAEQKMIDDLNIPEKILSNPSAECQVQTEKQVKQTKQFGTQTIEIQKEKLLPLGFEQVQDLVAKYSSAFSVSCTKVKQNHYLKDKFDREIFNIVESVVKESVQPFLETKFITYLEEKVKDISQHISSVFEIQLESLNEAMRKTETKQNNLRGRRIFQFSNQVNYIKQTVAAITDSLKANEIHKHAFNDLIIQEAKQMKEEITKIEKSITEIQNRSQASEKEVNDQITEIFQLLKTLEERHKENIEEDSSSCQEVSENESEQREIEVTSEDQVISQDSNEELEREEMQDRYSYPHNIPRGAQEHKKNKKSFDAFDNKGYSPYPTPDFYHAPPPVPQMPPYYYPFMPQVPSMPMHGYYHSNYPYPPQVKDEVSKIQVKKSKTSKKTKKPSD